MKKFIALLLALLMVFVCAVALASGDLNDSNEPGQNQSGNTPPTTAKKIDVSGLAEPTAEQTLTIKKNYTVKAPDGAELPPDALKFDLKAQKVEDGPYTDDTMPVASMAAELITGVNKLSYDVTITLPQYEKVGVFYYEFEESDNKVAGVTYIKNRITMRVTVIQDEVNNKLKIAAVAIRENGENGATTVDGKATYDLSKKVDSLENTYEAGSLKLEKTVTGNMGEYGKVWNFTIILKAPTNTTVFSKITATPDGANSAIVKIDDAEASGTTVAAGTGWTSKKIDVTLSHGGSIVFNNIPTGVEYTITEAEADQDNYDTSIKVDGTDAQAATGAIATKKTSSVLFTNDKNVEIDTGVALDFVPYVLIMALALAGFVALKVRRREDY